MSGVQWYGLLDLAAQSAQPTLVHGKAEAQQPTGDAPTTQHEEAQRKRNTPGRQHGTTFPTPPRARGSRGIRRGHFRFRFAPQLV